MGTVTCLYVFNQTICVVSTLSYLMTQTLQYKLSYLQYLAVALSFITDFNLYMCLLMFADYDDILSFLSRNLGECCGDNRSIRCCGRCDCACCTGVYCGRFNKCLTNAEMYWKVTTAVYNVICLAALWQVFSYEDFWIIPGYI